jgi:hypothetical protein
LGAVEAAAAAARSAGVINSLLANKLIFLIFATRVFFGSGVDCEITSVDLPVVLSFFAVGFASVSIDGVNFDVSFV